MHYYTTVDLPLHSLSIIRHKEPTSAARKHNTQRLTRQVLLLWQLYSINTGIIEVTGLRTVPSMI